ncbi:hypothetical protein WICPIJ_001823 [Wickerhamomyces pijperi]|uniref:Uncharacterized protein n=1 Tax=Wickerhamomyces pijperi TaxID=599730 RepID=A0A9P8QAV7_WICPI|nr:hypothetical protein WICPIJ_001823 [Wickerhamomyces pijperi]
MNGSSKSETTWTSVLVLFKFVQDPGAGSDVEQVHQVHGAVLLLAANVVLRRNKDIIHTSVQFRSQILIGSRVGLRIDWGIVVVRNTVVGELTHVTFELLSVIEDEMRVDERTTTLASDWARLNRVGEVNHWHRFVRWGKRSDGQPKWQPCLFSERLRGWRVVQRDSLKRRRGNSLVNSLESGGGCWRHGVLQSEELLGVVFTLLS